MPINRESSGIPGLDELIEGGFPIPSTVLIAGEPGTGKTTFSVQSLFHTARQGGTGIYLAAISEPPWVVQSFLSNF
nr:KaiA-binding protein [Thermoplasmata archaeon]NIS12222.1 KaiA-binding protein [Thermoplasmata archaeon]NIS20138.1 KaiA-binding protein [Thermoplasmata archaeon]NIT77464.1 KaiA-binding protein [Thermoplasmata archaeon]NIU49236.1 KaiA-binding protein [Thermoplasmata archaeon]